MEDRFQAVNIVVIVKARGGGAIRFAVGLGINRLPAVGATHGSIRGSCFNGAEGHALRQIDGVSRFESLIDVCLERRRPAGSIAVAGKVRGHIEGRPDGDAITEILGQDRRKVGVVAGQIAIRPASFIFERLRQIPVIDRAERANPGL